MVQLNYQVVKIGPPPLVTRLQCGDAAGGDTATLRAAAVGAVSIEAAGSGCRIDRNRMDLGDAKRPPRPGGTERVELMHKRYRHRTLGRSSNFDRTQCIQKLPCSKRPDTDTQLHATFYILAQHKVDRQPCRQPSLYGYGCFVALQLLYYGFHHRHPP